MTEEFASCIIDGSQRTGFVIQDNSQSLDLLEMVIVDIQQLEGVTGEIHKGLCDVFINMPSLPN